MSLVWALGKDVKIYLLNNLIYIIISNDVVNIPN